MTADVVSYGETTGLLDSERAGPPRMGGTVRILASRGVLADMVEHADIVFATLEEAALVTNATPADPATAATSIARLGPGDREGLPTRCEVDLVGGGDVVR